MSITRRLTVQLASLALGLTSTAAPVVAQSTHVLVPADKVQWGPAPPAPARRGADRRPRGQSRGKGRGDAAPSDFPPTTTSRRTGTA